jgi:hypothetical protein
VATTDNNGSLEPITDSAGDSHPFDDIDPIAVYDETCDGLKVRISFLGDQAVRIEVGDAQGWERSMGMRQCWTGDDGVWYSLLIPAVSLARRDGQGWGDADQPPLD